MSVNTTEDNLKEFSGSSKFSGGGIVSQIFHKGAPGFREIVLGVSILVLTLMIIILGVFVGIEKGKANQPQECSTRLCYEVTGWNIANMNKSVNPCNNFFQYACANYGQVEKFFVDEPNGNILGDLYYRNQERLRKLLEAPVKNQDWDSERKLKNLYMSCLDTFQKGKLRGTPVLTQILPKIGGWYVLNTWNSQTWVFNDALKVVQSDLWVTAFWSSYVQYDWGNRPNYALMLYPAGTGRYMRWNYYINPRTQKVRDDYKKFMRRVAYLLVRDYNMTLTGQVKSRVEDFINDAFTMEQSIAQFASSSAFRYNSLANENRISLSDLTKQTGNAIDWVEQATYIFKDSGVGKNTKVIVPQPQYFKSLGNLIFNVTHSNKMRMLNNYLVWRTLEVYIQDLSWEYVHANRELYVDLYGSANFLGTWLYCFNYVKRQMPEALGALFIMDHFEDGNKAKVTEITRYLKQSLNNMIRRNPWMDSQTKAKALEKAKIATYKLGYPDNLASQQAVDAIYANLTIDRSDWFQNILATNKLRQDNQKKLLKYGEDRNNWYYSTFDTNMAVLWYWNEIIVPAGLLQFPLYDYNMPHFFTFGSMGSMMGHFIVHIVDEYGRRWDKNGMYKYRQEWWSNQTETRYTQVKQCVINFYTNKTQGPFMSPAGQPSTFMINGKNYATEALAITSGVRLAYKSYMAWQKDNGRDLLAPTLGLSNEQMFFLSYAQSYCSNWNERTKYYRALYGQPLDEAKINMALQQLPEFATAFSCDANSPMNPPKKCQLY